MSRPVRHIVPFRRAGIRSDGDAGGDLAVHRSADAPLETYDGSRPPFHTTIDQNSRTVEWQKLWLATQRVPWNSLAIVPAGAMPPDFTLEIAVSLVQTGSLHLAIPIRIADATAVPLAYLTQFMSELQAVRRAGDLVLLALGPIVDNATTVALAQAADQALLCVPLGVSSVADAKRTVADIGAHRFLGSAAFRV
jgi:hypothetical protein